MTGFIWKGLFSVQYWWRNIIARGVWRIIGRCICMLRLPLLIMKILLLIRHCLIGTTLFHNGTRTRPRRRWWLMHHRLWWCRLTCLQIIRSKPPFLPPPFQPPLHQLMPAHPRWRWMTRASDIAIVFFFLHLSLIYQSLLFFIILLSPILILLCRHSCINFILSPPVIPYRRCALLLREASTTARGNRRHAEDKRETQIASLLHYCCQWRT